MIRASLLALSLAVPAIAAPAYAAGLQVVFPSSGYVTTSDTIFVLGSSPQAVTINGQAVERSPQGNFGPTIPLAPGVNTLTVRSGDKTVTIRVTRQPATAAVPRGVAEAAPAADVTRQPGEPLTLEALAAPGAHVTARVGGRTVELTPQPLAELPDNKAALTGKSQPLAGSAMRYQASVVFSAPGRYGRPAYTAELRGQASSSTAAGSIEILDPRHPQLAKVQALAGVARTGPSTDFSRLTPLPRGAMDVVTGSDGKWLRLGYGGWIDRSEVSLGAAGVPPHSVIHSIGARRSDPWTTVSFPLQTALPVSIREGQGTFTLSLHGATAQTDIIHLDRDPLIDWLDWTQATPDRIDYTFHLKTAHPWGYKLAYNGSTLELALRHAPVRQNGGPLAGQRIVLDPGHGGDDDPGCSGPDGSLEKNVTLKVALIARERLQQLGADVVISRDKDASVGLVERQAVIAGAEPTLSVSLHYNSMPDNGDVAHTQGVGAFWYNPQAQPFAAFMQRYLVEQLGRPSYGLFWDNLALTRPTVAPAILIECAFLSSPTECEWANDPSQQRRLGTAVAEGIAAYVQQGQREP